MIEINGIELFKDTSILDVRESRWKSCVSDINNFTSAYLLDAQEEIIEEMIQKYLLKVPTLYPPEGKDSKPVKMKKRALYPNHGERDRQVEGIRNTIIIPFNGDERFFQYRPTNHFNEFPRGSISQKAVILEIDYFQEDEVKLVNTIQNIINLIKECLREISNECETFNWSLKTNIRQFISKQIEKITSGNSLLEKLGIQIKKRTDLPNIYPVPVKRKRVEITSPEKSASQPHLEEKDYEDILSSINRMATVMEKAPNTFSKMPEESLRFVFLVPLNVLYEGQATGETFNSQGKTDILINVKGKNVFIAECKFWAGKRELFEAIDQILSYLNWRDTKTAILIFNRNKNFSNVLSEIEKAAPQHNSFKKFIKKNDESSFKYVFTQPNDEKREILLTIMAFDIPAAE
jgi:hypothetical protein